MLKVVFPSLRDCAWVIREMIVPTKRRNDMYSEYFLYSDKLILPTSHALYNRLINRWDNKVESRLGAEKHLRNYALTFYRNSHIQMEMVGIQNMNELENLRKGKASGAIFMMNLGTNKLIV